jgi:hypothetical protein
MNPVLAFYIAWVVWIFTALCAVITNYIWIFKLLVSAKEIGNQTLLLAIVSGVVPPIGAIHGVYIWFNGFTGL